MNRALKAGFLGAGIGFAVALMFLILKVRSPLILRSFWPTSALNSATAGSGTIWHLTFEILGFFGNAAIYGIVGYGLGRLIYPRESGQ